MLTNYFMILIFFTIVSVIACIMVLLAYLLAPQSLYLQKTTSYECGFEPFHDARLKFNIHFYIIAILFLLFDLEVAFIFPWLFALGDMESIGWISMFFFVLILTIGFVYEWIKGVLQW